MGIRIISNSEFYDPDNTLPFVELDDAIRRGLTTGLLDFGNQDCTVETGEISASTVFTSLTNGREQATAGTALGAIVTGMVELSSEVSGPKINLPDTYNLPSDCTEFLAIMWLKAPLSGWTDAVTTNSLMGLMSNTTDAQWGFVLTRVSGGTVGSLRGYFPVSDVGIGNIILGSGSVLSGVFDGTAHQIALHWARGDGQYTSTLYVDGVVVATATGAYTAGSIIVPAVTQATIGRAGAAFNAAYPNVRMGRPSLWNLSGSGASVSDILADDMDAAAGLIV